MQGQFDMHIVTPRWERTLSLRIWMDRPKRSFVRVLAPAKEAGIGSLRIGNEMWNYLPAVERTIKIPPSMMLQPWMGSDFTNDDLVKQSSAIDDYVQKVLGQETVEGVQIWRVEAVPKPAAAVVWGRIVYWVRRDFVPVRQEYFSDRGDLVRVMTFSDVRRVGGRTIPARWEMKPLGKPGNSTTIVVKDAAYDVAVDDEVFTQRNLQKR
jgi:outer membrane lipoprotein-sorting protein